MELKDATLYIFSGLPGSGKTTLSRLLARQVGAAYIRIDTIEQALRELCSVKVQGEGYRLAYFSNMNSPSSSSVYTCTSQRHPLLSPARHQNLNLVPAKRSANSRM